MATSVLSQPQFGGKKKKDPNSDSRKPKFPSTASKTMKVGSTGLPPAPSTHPHRQHAGARTHREVSKNGTRAK